MERPRLETRRQRYERKKAGAIWLPVSVACVNFGQEANIAYVIRAATCFGVKNVYVIGNITLNRDILNDLSGSAYDYVNIKTFSSPLEFVDFCKENDINIVALELSEDFPTYNLHSFKFDFSKENVIVVGNETTGVPVEVLKNGKVVYIPMNGQSFCLNTSQSCNIGLYECAKQYLNMSK